MKRPVKIVVDRNGDLCTAPLPRTAKQIFEFFHESYDVVDLGYKTPCWRWKHYLSHGYGVISINSKRVRANQYSLRLHKGDPPAGRTLACHDCDNPACVNPDHLYWGNHSTNGMDALERGLHIPLLGSDCGRAKLNESQVKKVRARHIPGVFGFKRLAKEFGLSESTIRAIVKRRSWRHI